MSVLTISEHPGGSGRLKFPPLKEQDIPIDANSKLSDPFSDGTRVIRVQAALACRFKVGPNTPDNPLEAEPDTGSRLAANETIEIEVDPGHCLAAVASD